MFPDINDRINAIQLCYNDTAVVDGSPKEHMACYYDYRITRSPTFAGNTDQVESELLVEKKVKGVFVEVGPR